MLAKTVQEITRAWIDSLVVASAPENQHLDYKRTLPSSSSEDKQEFLRDVTSFANASGGHIVYGVDESGGVPVGPPIGLVGVDADREILRLEQMANSAVDPRIPGLHFVKVDGFASGPVIVAHIPRSWLAPHRVSASADSRFYTRGSAGKIAMDTTQIRAAFLQGSELPQRLRRFREERLGRIVAGEAPVRLQDGPRVVLHIVPIQSIATDAPIDLSVVEGTPPMCLGGDGSHRYARYNFDGYVSIGGPSDDRSRGYAQVFRNGAIEAVCAQHAWSDKTREGKQAVFMNISSAETDIVLGVRRYLDLHQRLGLPAPYAIMISLLGMLGIQLPADSWGEFQGHPMDRDTMLLHDILIEDRALLPQDALRPLFDALWQSFGLPSSQHYDKNGVWKDNYRLWK